MGLITGKIENIISRRKANLGRIDNVLQNVKVCYENVKQLERFKEKLETDPSAAKIFGDNKEMVDKVLSISTEKFNVSYRKYQTELERLKTRFNRDNVHITFIGSAGQGKSLVMQKISGLSGNVIPSADGSDCTGAKSIITNTDGVNGVEAEIEFFTQGELVQIVNKYLEVLMLPQRVSSVYDIKNLNIDALREELIESHKVSGPRFIHLQKYVENIHDFEDCLGTTKYIKEDEIEEYVAQYKSDKHSVKYYKYLGVKKANIKCKFPIEDAGRIVLVDTIGTGATSLGTEEEMLKAIKNDSDAVIWMFKPQADRSRFSESDIELERKVREELGEEYTKLLRFLIINVVNGGAGDNTKTVDERLFEAQKYKWSLAEILKVNCIDEEAVKNQMLMPVLNQLAEHLNDADEIMLAKSHILGEKLYEEYKALYDVMLGALAEANDRDIKRQLYSQFKQTATSIAIGLRDYGSNIIYDKESTYYDKKNDAFKDCEEFKSAIRQKLNNIITKSISLKDIGDVVKGSGLDQHSMLSECCDIMRQNIINDFLKLDDILQQLIRNFKSEVLKILTAPEHGKLGYLIPVMDDNPEGWMEKFLEKLGKNQDYKYIMEAVKCFKEFKVSVEGFLIFIVRAELSRMEDGMDFLYRQSTPDMINNLGDKEAVVNEIYDILMDMAATSRNNIECAIADRRLYQVPHQAMFAAVKDFYERAALTRDTQGVEVKEHWINFYDDNCTYIWKEKCEEILLSKGVAKEWNDMLHSFESFDKEEMFLIR